MASMEYASPAESHVPTLVEPHDAAPPSTGQSRGPVAHRIMVTLEACAAHKRALTLMELVEATGLAKTTVHRMCWKLVELGLLEHSRDGFAIGSKVFELAGGNPNVDEVRNAAMPYLIELKQITGAMPHLAILNGGTALVLDGLYSRELAKTHRLVGAALPLHCTAVGKAIAAQLERQERESLLFSRRLRPATRRTIVVPEVLRQHIDRIRETGVAFSDEEYQPGAQGVAAGFRVRGGAKAAIGLMDVWNSRSIKGRQNLLIKAAAELEHQLA